MVFLLGVCFVVSGIGLLFKGQKTDTGLRVGDAKVTAVTPALGAGLLSLVVGGAMIYFG